MRMEKIVSRSTKRVDETPLEKKNVFSMLPINFRSSVFRSKRFSDLPIDPSRGWTTNVGPGCRGVCVGCRSGFSRFWQSRFVCVTTNPSPRSIEARARLCDGPFCCSRGRRSKEGGIGVGNEKKGTRTRHGGFRFLHRVPILRGSAGAEGTRGPDLFVFVLSRHAR